MKNLFFILIGATLILSSCKKKGCTDATATNYDSAAQKDDGSCIYPTVTPPPASSLICDGISGNNSYWPVSTGVYRRTKSVSGTWIVYFSDEVQGTTIVNGLTYFEVEHIDESPGGSTSTRLFRVAANGDVYKYASTGDILEMTGTPAIGQLIHTNYTITSLNASYTTPFCSYTGLVEASYNGPIGLSKIYFKKGVGQVGFSSATGSEHIVEFHQ